MARGFVGGLDDECQEQDMPIAREPPYSGRPGLQFLDLIQEGNIGLMKAGKSWWQGLVALRKRRRTPAVMESTLR